MIGLNGGLIGALRSPNLSTASGVWTGREQVLQIRASTWPLVRDPNFSNVSLLLHLDGAIGSTTFTDSSAFALNLTPNGNVQMNPTQSKFGGASALFDGTGDFLSRAYDVNFDFVLSDFTFEAWIYPTASKASGSRIMSTGGTGVAWNNTTGIHTLIQLTSTGFINLQLANNTGTPVSVASTGSVFAPNNAWSFLSVSVVGSNAHLAINGVSQTFALAARARPSTNPQIAIGTIPGEAGAVGTAFQGYMDEVRLTKGVGRYTGSFTPPALPFPNY
jgi:hypothetical protein